MPMSPLNLRLLLSLAWLAPALSALDKKLPQRAAEGLQVGSALSPSAVPSLDELSGRWLQVSPPANCTLDGGGLCRDSPVISNFWGNVGTCRDDIFSINSLTLAPYAGGNFSGTAAVGGAHFRPGLQRWSAYEALRRSAPMGEVRTTEGERLREATLETAVRMGFEKNLVMWELRVDAADPDLCPRSPEVEVSLLLVGLVRKLEAFPWSYDHPFDPLNFTASASSAGLTFSDKLSDAVAGFTVVSENGTRYVPHANGTGAAQTYLRLVPKTSHNRGACSGSVGVAMVVGDASAGMQRDLVHAAGHFETLWREAKDQWQARWEGAFVPPSERRTGLVHRGSAGFSGSLPVLETEDVELSRLYYMSCLTVLSLARWNPALTHRANRVTGTAAGNYAVFRFNDDIASSPTLYVEIGGAAQFYWDTSFHALMSAMLDPTAMRSQTLAVLAADIDSTNYIDLMTGEPGGQRYSFNAFTVFETALAVASLDPSFLEEPTPQGTVADSLRTLATKWRALRMEGRPCTADYGGDRNEFLEAVPTYIHGVPALQAANAFMLRSASRLASTAPDAAQHMREEADCIARSLFESQFEEGGFWCSLSPAVNGSKEECVPVRTCIDLITVVHALRGKEFEAGGLGVSGSEPTAAERMASFARRELLTPTWLRALSREGEPPLVNRPDHGTTGAYPAWPAGVAEALAVLDGNWSEALRYLRALGSKAGVTWEGPFGQASMLENPDAVDPTRTGGAYKTTRGATRFAADAGGAFAEVIMRSVFGYDPAAALTGGPSSSSESSLRDLFYKPDQPRANLRAKLRGVPLPGGQGLVTIETCPRQGLLVSRQ